MFGVRTVVNNRFRLRSSIGTGGGTMFHRYGADAAYPFIRSRFFAAVTANAESSAADVVRIDRNPTACRPRARFSIRDFDCDWQADIMKTVL